MSVTPKVGAVIFTPVNGTFTGAATIVCWTPTVGKSFLLLGWSLGVVVGTVLAAASPVGVVFVDDAIGTGQGPAVAAFTATQAAGTNGYSGMQVGPVGWQSGAANRVLKITGTQSITTGVVGISGMVWGREV